jgi:hypothetical protein
MNSGVGVGFAFVWLLSSCGAQTAESAQGGGPSDRLGGPSLDPVEDAGLAPRPDSGRSPRVPVRDAPSTLDAGELAAPEAGSTSASNEPEFSAVVSGPAHT